MTDIAAAAGRVRAWRQQLNADMRAWYERNIRPIPDPLFPADEDVPCRFGCGTDLRGPGGEELPLLLADIDEILAAAEWVAARVPRCPGCGKPFEKLPEGHTYTYGDNQPHAFCFNVPSEQP